jgi:hypothetical protein
MKIASIETEKKEEKKKTRLLGKYRQSSKRRNKGIFESPFVNGQRLSGCIFQRVLGGYHRQSMLVPKEETQHCIPHTAMPCYWINPLY